MQYRTWMTKAAKVLSYFQMINDDDIAAMRRQRVEYESNLKRAKHPTIYKILDALSIS